MKTFALLLFFISAIASAEPQIEHFFPDQSVLIGQPLFWIIKIRHPLWETYELKFAPCKDVKMAIDRTEFTEVAGEMRAMFRVSVIPASLKVSCTPSISISNEQGQTTTVLNGKSIRVRTISGNSEQIKNPAVPELSNKTTNRYQLLYIALALLGIAGLFLALKRLYANTPKQKLLRAIRKASFEVQKDRLPIQVWRLLRSDMIWGFSVDPFTPSQLHEKAGRNERLREIATTLVTLETWRYSGAKTAWDKQQVLRALANAENVLHPRNRLFGGKAA